MCKHTNRCGICNGSGAHAGLVQKRAVYNLNLKKRQTKNKRLDSERDTAVNEVAALSVQVHGNKKTHSVFMTTVLADDWIASDQTGVFPRTSNRGNKYICVFCVFDPNFIKGVPIKSRHKEELLRAYQIVYKWCETCGVKPQPYTKWVMRP